MKVISSIVSAFGTGTSLVLKKWAMRSVSTGVAFEFLAGDGALGAEGDEAVVVGAGAVAAEGAYAAVFPGAGDDVGSAYECG